MIRLTQVLTSILIFALSNGLIAHHSSAPHFDMNTEVTIAGTVTELKFVNPHAYLYFDEKKNGELVNWRCELRGATPLSRQGWTAETFTKGQKITVTGAPARREANVCSLNSLTLADGTRINRETVLTPANSEPKLAADSSPQPERPTYLENGQPNFEGPWISKTFGRNGIGIKPRYTATAAGKAAAKGYDMAFDDPILQCHIVNIFSGWNHDFNVNEITQTDETITMQYGFMDFVRTIHLNMAEHPQNIEASTGGHSIGHWEGDTLVIDTIGFKEGVLSQRAGTKHSDQLRSIERIHYDAEREYLIRDYTLTDPLYLVGETKGQDIMAIADEPYSPFNCVELSGKNNLRPSELPDAN